MYFEPLRMRTIVQRFAQLLSTGGFLFMGHAETLRGVSTDFDLCHTHETFYYRLVDPSLPPPQPQPQPQPLPSNRSDCVTARTEPAGAVDATRAMPAADGAWGEIIQLATARIRTLGASTAEPTAIAPGHTAHAADARLQRAAQLAYSRQLADAETICGQLLAEDAMNADAHYLLALCRERAGNAKGARLHDQYAIYLDPGFAMPRLHLGLLSQRAGDVSLARRELAQAHILMASESASRLLLFGDGFERDALLRLCQNGLKSCGAPA
jgi:chemotaxis protein methyltransferase CheR